MKESSMKFINYKEANTTEYRIPEYYSHFYPEANLLFFDIETTGFAAKNTTLYLIGVLWYEADALYIRQWFNDDGKSEAELLSSFQEFCQAFTHLIHFNGLGFDLPYLKQKADMLKISFTVDSDLQQIDIFKEIRSYKKLFSLDNMKQVTIEQFLGIKREDTYNGGELINVYQRYVARPDETKEHILLLHNHDDLLGMPKISQILNYKAFMEQVKPHDIVIEETEGKLTIHFQFESFAFLPKRLSVTKNGIYLNAMEQTGLLQIPIFTGTLKHFFPDYKNYYYLPKEDMALHKSVATYVESDNKIKATKSTCYVKKTDAFIPCLFSNYTETFQNAPKDKDYFITKDCLLQGDVALQTEYILHALQTFL